MKRFVLVMLAVFTAGAAFGQDAQAWFNSGNTHLKNRDYDRAIAAYTQAIALAPREPSLYNNRGIAYDSKGDYDRAIADFSEACRLEPANQEYRDNLQAAQNAKAGR